MRMCRVASYTKLDRKPLLAWILKYRKRVLVGPLATRLSDLISRIAKEHKLHLTSGRMVLDDVHVFLESPVVAGHQQSRVVVEKNRFVSPPSGVPRQRKPFWARGSLTVGSGSLTDEMLAIKSRERKGNRCATAVNFKVTTT